VLSFDVQPSTATFGQMVIVTKGLAVRDKLRADLQAYLTRTFPGTDAYVKLLEIGPPVGRPVQYRVSGPDVQTVRNLAQKAAGLTAADPNLAEPALDWNEPARVVKIDVLQDKARQLGVSSQDIASALNTVVTGANITQVRDDIYLINVVDRANAAERGSIDTLRSLQLPGANGQSVPLAAVAKFRYGLEQPEIWRRNRLPTITVQAALRGAVQAATVVDELAPSMEAFRQSLPAGYQIVAGGAVEESGKAQGPIAAVAPLMLFIMATILMLQLQSFQRLFLVFAVAPLALIGVVSALLLSHAPLGFVAILGVLALIGILIRNSVILIIQIEHLRAEGRPPWEAVIEATEHRMRPILLTAAAATLALIPISREIFWGPMAYAMMGGIIVGTILTLLFLPALYVAWFRLQEPAPARLAADPKMERSATGNVLAQATN
jgi:multidrug efflux pump subunit AcrB